MPRPASPASSLKSSSLTTGTSTTPQSRVSCSQENRRVYSQLLSPRRVNLTDCHAPYFKEARRAATAALTLEEQLAGQKQIKALESQRNEERRSLFEAQDKVDLQRVELISTIEGKLTQRSELKTLFTLRWALN